MFVLGGIFFIVFTLYMIGKNRNLLGSTFTIRAIVSNVNGLVPGNNVRFKGIDVGTVKSLRVENDSSISVVMYIDKSIQPYLRKNAIASIGSDGLMGNKLININSQPGDAAQIEEGDLIFARKPVETDEMLRTLNTTNENIEKITGNLYEISVKLNNSKSLWSLLSDTAVTRDLKVAVSSFRQAGSNTQMLTDDARHLIRKFDAGEGLANKLFTDTTLASQLALSLQQLRQASTKSSGIMDDLKKVIDNMNEGQGTAGLILRDTVLRQKLSKSAFNIEQGTARFNENMEALKDNFLFRHYFKKLEKEAQENTKASAN